jgi:hypothetical protein
MVHHCGCCLLFPVLPAVGAAVISSVLATLAIGLDELALSMRARHNHGIRRDNANVNARHF